MKFRVLVLAILAMMSCFSHAKIYNFDFELSMDVKEPFLDFDLGQQTFNGELTLFDTEGDGVFDYSDSLNGIGDEILAFNIDINGSVREFRFWRAHFKVVDDTISDFWVEAYCGDCQYSYLELVGGIWAPGSTATFTDHWEWQDAKFVFGEWSFSSATQVSEPMPALVFASALFGLMIARRRKV